ncbi:MAG: hypothetical protein WKF40_00835 [Thermoleophilaceae bacterium]
MRFRGGGTKFDWGAAAAEPDVELSTLGLDRIRRAQRRATSPPWSRPASRFASSCRQAFAAAGQMLALDPPLGEDERGHHRRHRRHRRTRGRCATGTGPCATSSSG